MTEAELRDFWALVTDVWNNGLYGIDIGHILLALLILAGFLLTRDIITRFILNRVRAWAERTETTIDDAIIDSLHGPIRLVPVIMGVFFATSTLQLDDTAYDFANRINRSLIAFAIFWSLYRASDPVGQLLQKAERFLTTAIIQWLTKALKVAFILIGAATILEIWGIQVGPLVAGLGLFGVAVALGAQDLFKNLIAGLFLLGERRFHPGDWILVAGVVEGTVEHIGFRTTKVRRFDKAPVYVPNAALADAAVTNFSRMTYRRIKWMIGLRYDSTAEQLETVRTAIEDYIFGSQDFVSPEDTTTMVRIDRFGASSIDILIYCFTRTTNWLEWLAIKETLLLAIKRIVEEAGTDFAFPSQSLYVEALGTDFQAAPLSPLTGGTQPAPETVES